MNYKKYIIFLWFILYLSLMNAKIINIYPGGLHGFYMMGICKYIKNNYKLNDYKFYGASAGSWNGLYLTFKDKDKYSDQKFIENIENTMIDERPKSIYKLQLKIKEQLLENYNIDDFDIERLYISVAEIEKPIFRIKKRIYNNFESLDDVTNCCIASSHLPIISGKLSYKYNDHYCLDGGIFSNPFLNLENKNVLNIRPFMWKREKKYKNNLKEIDIKQSIEFGYEEAHKNREFLNTYLL